MIKVSITRKEKLIKNITVSGHADSGPYGHDLVCAAVSAVTIGMLNMLNETKYVSKEMYQYEIKDGYVAIEVLESNRDFQLILETLEMNLDSIKYSYSKYIKITKVEV